MPAIERILQMYPGLKSYFLSQAKCPVLLKDFFNNPSSEAWLHFVHSQSYIFHQTVLKIEGTKISAIEVSQELNELKNNLYQKCTHVFIPMSVKTILKNTELNQASFENSIKEFYHTCNEYLGLWTLQFEEIKFMSWVTLKKIPTWSQIEETVEFAIKKGFFSPSLDSKLFDEFTCILNFVSGDTIFKWNNENIDTSNRWVKVFSHFKENQIPHDLMSNLIQYILCLPGSNASTERVFSQMNKIWTKEKSQLKIETLKAILVTKTNVDMNCSEFYSFLKKSPLLLKSIASNDKY
jgi:hypothetical protein